MQIKGGRARRSALRSWHGHRAWPHRQTPSKFTNKLLAQRPVWLACCASSPCCPNLACAAAVQTTRLLTDACVQSAGHVTAHCRIAAGPATPPMAARPITRPATQTCRPRLMHAAKAATAATPATSTTARCTRFAAGRQPCVAALAQTARPAPVRSRLIRSGSSCSGGSRVPPLARHCRWCAGCG